jgi:hypothetical protein
MERGISRNASLFDQLNALRGKNGRTGTEVDTKGDPETQEDIPLFTEKHV